MLDKLWSLRRLFCDPVCLWGDGDTAVRVNPVLHRELAAPIYEGLRNENE